MLRLREREGLKGPQIELVREWKKIERASGAANTEMDSLAIRRASVILEGLRSS